MEWRLLMACLVFCTTSAQNVDIDNEETDGQSSRKILGSSVVTSVSVVMETGNGKHTYFSDAVGHPLSKPHIASQVASPINLLNPDRYEFYTFNDDGELVKRLMTLKEIQGIIAGGDGEAYNYNSEYHAQLHHPENDVSGVVENVQNVLKEEMEAHKTPLEDHPIIDTPDVSATWNLILPAFFGGDTVTIRETPEEKYHYVSQMMPLDESTERLNISSRNPDDTEENVLPNLMEVISTLTETKTNEKMPSTSSYTSSITTSNTKPIPVVITTEKIKLNDISTSSSMHKITTNVPMQTKETEEDLKEIFPFNENKIDVSTEGNIEKLPDIFRITTSTTENNKMNYSPDMTMNENKTDTTIGTIEYPKNTELVSMITRPTTKASEKTTASVTFPPTTQFTHSEQISQTSATLKPVSIKEKNTETPPLSTSDINNDNFVIVTLNNNKNNNLEQDLSNETINVKNISQLSTTKYDVISNVEQIIENGSNITDNDKIATENYNITEEIKEILKSPDFNNSVTLASSIIDSNKISTNTENVPLSTITSSTNKITTTSLFEPTTFSKIVSTQNIAHLNTTEHKMHTFTTTPISHLKENAVTTSITKPITTQKIETTTPKIKITNTPKTTTTEKIQTTTTPKIQTTTTPKLTTTTPKLTTTTKMISTTAPKIKTTTTTIPFSVSTVKHISTTEKNIRIESPTTFRSTETTKMLTSLIIPISTTEQFIVNRFKVPSTTSSTLSTQETTVKLKTDNKTTLNETTEKVIKPITTTKKQTITTIKPTTNNINKIPLVTTTTTTKKPSTYKITFVTKENITKSTTVTPKTTTSTKNSSNLPSSTTIKTAQPLTVTTKIIPTTLPPLISTISGSINNSEPYRKTEEFLQSNKISTQGDTWKLVDTVKPPEYTSNKIPNTTVLITTTKPLLEPYQPPVKVDLSTQGNFGITGLNEDMLIFSKMYNELALKFWSALSHKDITFDRSAVVSPFGAISMLAMIFLGARGSTSEEMNDVLKLDDIITFNPHLVIKEVTESVIARKSPSVIVRELYSDIYRGKVLEFYKERVKQFYDGHVEEVEFKKIHNVIRRRTNSLISKQTKGQLPQYLEETTLSLRAPLSALSTNIFQADCSQATTEGRDGELYFIVLPSIRQRRLVPIPAAVWRTGFIAGYDPELDATAVSLGTMNQAVSTVFVMPGQQGHSAPGDVLLRLEARLLNTTYIPETWTQLLKSMLPRPGLEIQLPRFLQKSVINSTDALKRMGLKDMFNKNKADLRGINGIGHDLYFSDMVQVNEFSICGETQQMHTEIYPSMTEHLENHNEQMRNFKYVDYFEENEYDKYSSIPLPLRPRQARLPEIPRLRFDRPFLYFVRHNPTGLILHMGRFNPRLLT